MNLETSLHLFQSPLYGARNGSWHKSYLEAVKCCGDRLTWDPAAILSVLSFSYACGDRTLVNEIKRRPWLSQVGPDNKVRFEDIPPHGRLRRAPGEVADRLGQLLYQEALEVCQGRKEIYLLLSGGLDSRIIAGIVAKLTREGKLETTPVAVTWGLPDSRDVAYGRAVAESLGFEWIHVNIGPENVVKNIEETAVALGGLVPAYHLHSMGWFENASQDALVLGGCYGDSVGRAEFSDKHVLELDYLRPVNRFGLIRSEILGLAYDGVMADLKALRARTQGQPKYVLCEHEMQGHYMRGMIGHAMSAINRYCTVYQMFTHPRVYSYMWSIHPALRTEDVYVELLGQLDSRLARLPWARTNRALKGKTEMARKNLRRDFHDYPAWISGPIYDQLRRYVDSQWFAETGIFDADRISDLAKNVLGGQKTFQVDGWRPFDAWVWLAGFRRFAQRLSELGKKTALDEKIYEYSTAAFRKVPEDDGSYIRKVLRRMPALLKLAQALRRFVRRRQALLKYPPDDFREG